MRLQTAILLLLIPAISSPFYFRAWIDPLQTEPGNRDVLVIYFPFSGRIGSTTWVHFLLTNGTSVTADWNLLAWLFFSLRALVLLSCVRVHSGVTLSLCREFAGWMGKFAAKHRLGQEGNMAGLLLRTMECYGSSALFARARAVHPRTMGIMRGACEISKGG
jgi:hypothetical protein